MNNKPFRKVFVSPKRWIWILALVFIVFSSGEVLGAFSPNDWWNSTRDFTCDISCNSTGSNNYTIANLTIDNGGNIFINNSELNFTKGEILGKNGQNYILNITNSIIRGNNDNSLNRIRLNDIGNVSIRNTILEKFYTFQPNNIDNLFKFFNVTIRFSSINLINLVDSSNIEIYNSTFYNSSGNDHCIILSNSQNILIDNALVYNCADTGIKSDKESRNITIQNTIVENVTGHCLSAQNTTYVRWINNNVKGCSDYGLDAFGYGNHTYVENNTVSNAINGVIFSFGDTSFGSSVNSTSKNNEVYNLSSTAYGYYFNNVLGGTSLNDYASGAMERGLGIVYSENIHIENITLESISGFSIIIGTNSNNVTIINANITNANISFSLGQNISNISIINPILDKDENYYGYHRTSEPAYEINFSDVMGYHFYFDKIEDLDFNITKSYLYFESTSVQDNNISLYSLSNALIYNTNRSIYGSSNINSNDGNINITLPPNNASYVLDNYKLNQSETRANNPISIIGTSTSKTITSSLVDTINATVVFTIANDYTELRSIQIDRPTSADSIVTSGWTINGNQVTYDLNNIDNGVTTLTLITATCTTWEAIMYPILLLLITLSVFLLSIWFLKGDLDYENIKEWKNLTLRNLIITFLIIVIGIAFINVFGDTFAVRCTL